MNDWLTIKHEVKYEAGREYCTDRHSHPDPHYVCGGKQGHSDPYRSVGAGE